MGLAGGLLQDVRALRRGRDWRGRATVPRSAEPWVPRREHKPFPTAWARTPAARAARVVALDGVLRTLAWTQTRPEVYGADLLGDVRGPVVFVCNHASHLDTPLILGSLPSRLRRRVAVGAAADYFFDARWRAVATALTFNAFPIERRTADRRRSHDALDLASRLVADGWSLLLFPEATRSQDGWMRRFRLGSAQLCSSLGVPAVPIAVRGSYAAMPRGRNWPKPGRPTVAVRYGRPVTPGAEESMRDFSVRLERAVARLWAEQDVGWWESLRGARDDRDGDQRAAARGPEAATWRRIWESTRTPRPGRRQARVWTR